MSDTERTPATTLRVGVALGGIVLAAVVVFGLGVMVGERVAERAPAPAAAPVAAAAPPQAASAAPASQENMTFYDRLSGTAPAAPVAPISPRENQPVPQTTLTPVATQAPAHAAAEPPAPTRENAVRQPEKPAPPRTATERPSSAPPPPRAAPERIAAPVAVATAKTPAVAEPAARIRKLSGKGRFSVQVTAVNARADADETAARLRRQGFETVTVMASIKGKIWYRVRVGSFPNQKAATEAAAVFHSAFGLDAIPVQD